MQKSASKKVLSAQSEQGLSGTAMCVVLIFWILSPATMVISNRGLADHCQVSLTHPGQIRNAFSCALTECSTNIFFSKYLPKYPLFVTKRQKSIQRLSQTGVQIPILALGSFFPALISFVFLSKPLNFSKYQVLICRVNSFPHHRVRVKIKCHTQCKASVISGNTHYCVLQAHLPS